MISPSRDNKKGNSCLQIAKLTKAVTSGWICEVDVKQGTVRKKGSLAMGYDHTDSSAHAIQSKFFETILSVSACNDSGVHQICIWQNFQLRNTKDGVIISCKSCNLL